MRAFIKNTSWNKFLTNSLSFGFLSDYNKKRGETIFVKPIDFDLFLIITLDREIHLVTQMGESPFMESHESEFQDLVNEGMVEYVKGEFD